jgi:hypothetical protein
MPDLPIDGPLVDPAVAKRYATALAELNALKRIVATLDDLDAASRNRALRWLTDRYAVDLCPNGGEPS